METVQSTIRGGTKNTFNSRLVLGWTSTRTLTKTAYRYTLLYHRKVPGETAKLHSHRPRLWPPLILLSASLGTAQKTCFAASPSWGRPWPASDIEMTSVHKSHKIKPKFYFVWSGQPAVICKYSTAASLQEKIKGERGIPVKIRDWLHEKAIAKAITMPPFFSDMTVRTI